MKTFMNRYQKISLIVGLFLVVLANGQDPFSMKLDRSTVEIQESFVFKHHMNITLHSIDAHGMDNTVQMILYMQDPGTQFAMDMETEESKGTEEGKITMVFNTEKNQLLMMVEAEGQKIGMVMPFNPEGLDEGDEASNDKNNFSTDWVKTGKTKEILGYLCEQYVMDDENGHGEAWISDAEELKVGEAMKAFGRKDRGSESAKSNYPDGAILQFHMTSNDGTKMDWNTTAIYIDKPVSLSTDGYSFMPMGQ